MAEAPAKKRRRRPRSSTVHLTVWTMNGEPLPDTVQRELEEAMQAVLDSSSTRCASSVRRF